VAPNLPQAFIDGLRTKYPPKVKIDINQGVSLGINMLPIFARVRSVRLLTRLDEAVQTQQLLVEASSLHELVLNIHGDFFRNPAGNICAMKKLTLGNYAWGNNQQSECDVWNFSRLHILELVNDIPNIAGFASYFSQHKRLPQLRELKISMFDFSPLPRLPALVALSNLVAGLRGLTLLQLNNFDPATLPAALPQISSTLKSLRLTSPRGQEQIRYLSVTDLIDIIGSCVALEDVEFCVLLEDVSTRIISPQYGQIGDPSSNDR
jgi:hypothetical protein